jgi:hypothetical protein
MLVRAPRSCRAPRALARVVRAAVTEGSSLPQICRFIAGVVPVDIVNVTCIWCMGRVMSQGTLLVPYFPVSDLGI